MRKIFKYIIFFISPLLMTSSVFADQFDFNSIEKRFKNFIRCELTRTGATNHFNGQSFKITMIDLFDVQPESGIKIYTGAVECFAGKSFQKMFAAVGTKSIMEDEQVQYFVIRKQRFNILATELVRYPYMDRCKWLDYWIDIE